MSNILLDAPFILETRRNHALEHATIHVLERKFPNQHMAGHSSHVGYIIIGKFNAQDILAAATEAMTRLRAGESKLAIHAGCGTNFAATTVLAGTFAWLPLRGARTPLGRLWLLPVALIFAAVGYFLSQPAGPWLQANVTTEPDLGDMKIIEVRPVGKNIHRVVTK